MSNWFSMIALIAALGAGPVHAQVINIPQSDLLPLGDPGMVSWIPSDAGISGPTTMKMIAEITGTAVANWLLLDTQGNGFPAPPTDGVTDDLIVFEASDVPGEVITVDVTPGSLIALFHDVYDETGGFLTGPDGILNDNPLPGTDDAYLSCDTSKNFTIEGRRQLVKYFPADPTKSYQFTSQWGTVTQLGTGYRVFLFLDDDHSPNYDYDDMIVGIVAPNCEEDADCLNTEACDGEESCVDGVCQPGTPINCDDGNFCNGTETCVEGSCVGGTPPSCDDNVACTDDSCSENECVHTPNAALCPGDGTFCNGVEACNPLTGCVSPGNPCDETQVCDESLDACRACANDDECDDGNPCTVGHACNEGMCIAAVPVDCSGSDTECADAACDPSGEPGNCDILAPLPNGTPCSDGLYCTNPDTCVAGVCAGPVRDCSSAGGPCHIISCNEELDQCQAIPRQEGASCDDGLFCTVAEQCNSGQCTGLARNCNAFTNQCNSGVCNEGQDRCEAEPVDDETVCNDGNDCTVGDACTSGVCGGVVQFGLEQWSHVADCLSGPATEAAENCGCQDLDEDGFVDLSDVALFQNSSTGP